jgi:hypothetical protein
MHKQKFLFSHEDNYEDNYNIYILTSNKPLFYDNLLREEKPQQTLIVNFLSVRQRKRVRNMSLPGFTAKTLLNTVSKSYTISKRSGPFQGSRVLPQACTPGCGHCINRVKRCITWDCDVIEKYCGPSCQPECRPCMFYGEFGCLTMCRRPDPVSRCYWTDERPCPASECIGLPT